MNYRFIYILLIVAIGIAMLWLYIRNLQQLMPSHLHISEDYETSLSIPYAHVVPQLEWIIEHSGNKVEVVHQKWFQFIKLPISTPFAACPSDVKFAPIYACLARLPF